MIFGLILVELDGAFDQPAGLSKLAGGCGHHTEQKVGIRVCRRERQHLQTRRMRALEVAAVQALFGLPLPVLNFFERGTDQPSLISQGIAEFYTDRARPQYISGIAPQAETSNISNKALILADRSLCELVG